MCCATTLASPARKKAAAKANVMAQHIEGIADASHLHRLQQTILDCGGAQCGICTPGIIMAACHLLNRNPQPTTEQIKEGLSGNLCRCTGYAQICEAVTDAARWSER